MIFLKLKKITAVSIIVVGLFTFASCSKDVDIPEFALPGCDAGRTGNITLLLKPQHHGDSIPSLANYPDTAYIKFNTSEYPGGDDPALYDLVATGTAGSIEVVVDSMNCGKYFIFMTGFDVSIAERVKGGIPVTLFETDTVRTIIVPVTED